MKVAVSVLGRFHAFDLARELHRVDALDRLYTSYPSSRATAFDIPRARVSGAPAVEWLNRCVQRVERASSGRVDPRVLPCSLHDRRVASLLRPGPDVFVGWSGSSVASIARARELGMLALVERGSTHILHQRDVLREEYERWGIPGRLPNEAVIERELAEYASADRIVVPTRCTEDTFVARGISRERIVRAPYGVSLTAFRPPVRPRSSEEFVLMHCGNVSLRKGSHYLLQAFRELRLPNARLVFVGPIAEEIRPLLARWRGPDVTFTGRVPQAELLEHYARASAFCLPSLEEGMAMVIAQAMACGLPVVATRESGAEEIVRDGVDGRLVRARDLESLSRGILELYEDADRRREMGARAAERAADGFSWRDYGRRVLAAYGRAASRSVEERRCA